MYENIPQALTTRPQWVCWNHEKRGGLPTKVPYTPGTNKRASSTDPATWRTFDQAVADRTKSGIGFVFTADDPYVGIDLDDCLELGELKPWAVELLAMLPPTYAEVSPSGKGIKLWVAGEKPKTAGCKVHVEDGAVEVYDCGRYFTVTGDTYGPAHPIAQADLSTLCNRLWPTATKPRSIREYTASLGTSGSGFDGDDAELIRAIRNSRSGAEFDRLWSGNTGGDDPSSDDMTLVNMLTWWCGPNPARIDSLFRQSGLYRNKWDENRGDQTYGQLTISKALATTTSFYQPKTGVQVNTHSGVIKRAAEGRPYAMTDVGNAERLAEHFQGRIRHCEVAGGWYVYDGMRWVRDTTGQATYFGISAIRAIYREADAITDSEAKQAMLKHGGKSEAAARIKGAVSLAASLPGVAIGVREFDADPWLLNVRNGTIDLRTGQLQPHDAKHNITKLSPTIYHPQATAPLWHRFLMRIFDGNVELIEFVQELMGICLSGDISEQIMPIFYGDGSNGKSTLLDTVMAIMGDYASKAAPDLLMERMGSEHATEIADLWGLRMVVASETEEGQKLRIARVKEMTGDSMLKARYMRGDFFTFPRTFKLILMTNHKPRISDNNYAIWRRLVPVPFKAKIADHEKDKDLMLKLVDEWPGILNWMVKGLLRWRASGGLDKPVEVQDAIDEYRDDEDPLIDFIAQCIVDDSHAFTPSRDIRQRYHAWASAEDIAYPLGDRALIARLREKYKAHQQREGGRVTRGLKGMRLA